MNDREKISAAIDLLKKLRRMVGFFMKKEISELIDKLEENETVPGAGSKEQGTRTYWFLNSNEFVFILYLKYSY